MLYHDKIELSEEIDINKTSASKECDTCHYWYFETPICIMIIRIATHIFAAETVICICAAETSNCIIATERSTNYQ